MFLRRCDVESGAGEWVVSSLAAPFLAEGITHPEDVCTLAPRGAFPEEYRTGRGAQHHPRGAVEIERHFICEVLSCDIIRMCSDMMVKCIELVADRQLGCLAAADLRGDPPLRHVHVPEGNGPGVVAGFPWRARVCCVGVCPRGVLVAGYFC